MLTQSVGVPSTAYTASRICSSRSGRLSVNACPIALASSTGATMVTSPSGRSASARIAIPSERYPSSLVTRIKAMRNDNYINGPKEPDTTYVTQSSCATQSSCDRTAYNGSEMADVTLADVLARETREGELYETLPDGRLRCYACGHCCPLPDGAV